MLVRLGRWTLRWRWSLPIVVVLLLVGGSAAAEETAAIDEEEYMTVASKTQLVIAGPEEGQTVGPNPHVHVNLFTADTESFSRVFKDSYLCLRLDEQPYSCWPVSFARMKLAGLPEGPHELTAVLLHPETRKPLTTSDTRFFRSHPNPDSLKEAPPAAPVQDAPQLEAPPGDTPAAPPPEVVAIDVPVVVVSTPGELSGTGPDFHVVSDIHVSNMTLFRHLFANDFICLSLDNAPSSCWPLSQSEHHPLFVGVPDGLHTLIASITHPIEGHVIPETKSKRRTFFSLESEESSASALARPRKASQGLSVMQGIDPTATTTTSTSSSGQASSQPPPPPPAAAEAEQQQQQQPPSSSGSKRFSAKRLEPAVMLEVDVDGQPVSLTFHRRSNRTEVAQQFCERHADKADADCVPSIVALLDSNVAQLDASPPMVVQ